MTPGKDNERERTENQEPAEPEQDSGEQTAGAQDLDAKTDWEGKSHD